MGDSYSTRVAAEQVFPLGSEVTVWYDPADPGRAVLRPGVGWHSVVPLGIGAVVGFVGLVLGMSAGRKKGDGVSPVMR